MEANSELDAISTADLESSITQLCARINAATYQQLIMIAEFDRRQGWGHEGVRSCAHWLNWRCGISITAAREKLRVAHALDKLPQTREAFAQGLLRYSKARAITRVGTEHNEQILLSFARYGTASQLDKTVRLYRQQYDMAGALSVGYHQSALDPEEQDYTTDAQRRDAENQGAMHHQEHRELSVHWDEHGCLAIRARLTPEQGAVIIKALEAAVESLKQAEPSEGFDSHVHEQADEHTQNNTSAGVYRLNSYRHMPRRKADALVLMAEAFLKDTKVSSHTDDRYQVVVHVDSDVLSQQVFETKSGKPDCYIEKHVALPVETARRLSCSCKIVTALTREGEPMNIGRSSRAIPTGIRRALAIRDSVCQFPGCDCQQHLDAHHIVHWANGGETSLANLVEVCHHHHTLLHEGQFSVSRQSTGELVFSRPNGTRIERETSIAAEPDTPELGEDQHPWSASGETMDYSVAVSCIAVSNQQAHGGSRSPMDRLTKLTSIGGL